MSILAVPSKYKSFHSLSAEPKSKALSLLGTKLALELTVLWSILANIPIEADPSTYTLFHSRVGEPKS